MMLDAYLVRQAIDRERWRKQYLAKNGSDMTSKTKQGNDNKQIDEALITQILTEKLEQENNAYKGLIIQEDKKKKNYFFERSIEYEKLVRAKLQSPN